MMPVLSWHVLLTALYVTTYAAICYTLIRRKQVHAWPTLLAYCAFELIHTLANLALAGRSSTYTAYFYTYWLGSGIASLLIVGVLLNAVRNIPLAEHIPTPVRHFTAWLTILASSGTALVAALNTPTQSGKITTIAAAMNHASMMATGVVSMCMLATIALCGMRWSATPLYVVNGVILQTALGIPASYLLAAFPAQRTQIYLWQDALAWLALPVWLWALTRPVERTSEAHESALAVLFSADVYVPPLSRKAQR